MEFYIAYAISFGCLFGAFVLLHVYRVLKPHASHLLQAFLRKWFLHAVVFRRRSGSSDCTTLAAVTLLAYVGGNVYCAFSGIASQEELTERLGQLCLINIVPLYLGGRTSYVVDRVLGMDLNHYHFMHRWIGRVCIAHGLAHGILRGIDGTDKLDGIEIALLSLFGSVAIVSFVAIRRRIYELFLFSHTCAAPAILVLLWIHTPSPNRLFYITIGASLALWILQKLLWLVFFVHRNGGWRAANMASVEKQMSQGMLVQIDLCKPLRAVPGHYIYVTIPQVRSYGLGYFEAHPFYLLPELPRDDEGGKTTAGGLFEPEDRVPPSNSPPQVFILVEAANGFSRKLLQSQLNGLPAMIDGPYGRKLPLDRFDTVLFLASGLGIAAQLLHIHHLVVAHNAKTARARRITLVWFLQAEDQNELVEGHLRRIVALDTRSIVNIHRYAVKKRGGEDAASLAVLVSAILELEYAAEAGNKAIYLCGPPRFEAVARKALIASKRDISLFTSSFQPDETLLSRRAYTEEYEDWTGDRQLGWEMKARIRSS